MTVAFIRSLLVPRLRQVDSQFVCDSVDSEVSIGITMIPIKSEESDRNMIPIKSEESDRNQSHDSYTLICNQTRESIMIPRYLRDIIFTLSNTELY